MLRTCLSVDVLRVEQMSFGIFTMMESQASRRIGLPAYDVFMPYGAKAYETTRKS